MSSARIDLSSRAQVCSMGGIDRTKPAIMEPYLSDVEWDKFCNDVDAVLAPVHFWNKVAMGFFGLTFLTFVIVIIVQFATFASSDPFDNDDGMPSATLFIIPVVSMIVGGIGMCLFAYKASQASLALEGVCRETSEKQPRLSFHVRYERHFVYYGGSGVGVNDHHHHHGHTRTTQYIEVSINPNNPTVQVVLPMEQAVVATPTTGVIVDDLESGNKSTAERLADLEKAKAYLTDKEYEEKRAQILASL